MKRNLHLLLLPLFLASLPLMFAQEESPVLVDPLRVSKTVFTNWDLIQLRYTVRYLDGYELKLDQAEPNSMSFGVLEPDPILGEKLIKENERRYVRYEPNDPVPKIEHYVDLVYYLRHIGPKKGEVEIPEQVFSYIELGPGGQHVGQELKQVKVPGVKLNYFSVLTKDANDIKDVMDFGTFMKLSRNWKISAVVGFFISTALVWLLVFRKPTLSRQEAKKIKMAQRGQATTADERLVLKPNVARRLLAKQLADWCAGIYSDGVDAETTRKKLCNLLYEQFLPAYVPGVLGSDAPKDILGKIDQIQSPRVRELLTIVSYHLEYHEKVLYEHGSSRGRAESDLLQTLLNVVNNLRSDRIFRFNAKTRIAKCKVWCRQRLVRLRGAR